jgi:hypothetical protein
VATVRNYSNDFKFDMLIGTEKVPTMGEITEFLQQRANEYKKERPDYQIVKFNPRRGFVVLQVQQKVVFTVTVEEDAIDEKEGQGSPKPVDQVSGECQGSG